MKKIVLLDMASGLQRYSPDSIGRNWGIFEPIGLQYLSASLNKAGYETDIIQQCSESQESIVSAIIRKKPDAVGLSCLAHNTGSSMKIAQVLKQKNPELIILVGGEQPTATPKAYFETCKSIDYVVLGEGEFTTPALLENIFAGKTVESLDGIACRSSVSENLVIVNRHKPRNFDIGSLPWPERKKEFIQRSKIIGLTMPTPSQQIMGMVISSRGCYNKCSFCTSPHMFGKKIRYRPINDVVKEIAYLQKAFDVNMIYFPDIMFNGEKSRVRELCTALKDEFNGNLHWTAMVRPAMLDPDLLSVMKESGCNKLSYGLETIIPEIQSSFEKIESLENFKKITWAADELGIINRVYIMIGDPEFESTKTIRETSEMLNSMRFSIDDLRVTILTPFPGTELYEYCLSKGYMTRKFDNPDSWQNFTSDSCILERLEHLTPGEINSYKSLLFKEFITSKAYRGHTKDKLRRFPQLKQSYEEFFSIIKKTAGIDVL